MKCVLLSIKPKWCDLIVSGHKTIEIRKSVPKISYPFKVYIYQTKSSDACDVSGCGKVIGEFICGETFPINIFENGSIQDYNYNSLANSCVPYDDISEYIGKNKTGYGWVISNLKIYDEYKDLNEFFSYGYFDTKAKSMWYVDEEVWRVTRPPQSYMFVESLVIDEFISTNIQKVSSEHDVIKEYKNINDPAEQLKYYRNLHYSDSSDSESYIIACALDRILPELVKFRKEKEYGK